MAPYQVYYILILVPCFISSTLCDVHFPSKDLLKKINESSVTQINRDAKSTDHKAEPSPHQKLLSASLGTKLIPMKSDTPWPPTTKSKNPKKSPAHLDFRKTRPKKEVSLDLDDSASDVVEVVYPVPSDLKEASERGDNLEVSPSDEPTKNSDVFPFPTEMPSKLEGDVLIIYAKKQNGNSAMAEEPAITTSSPPVVAEDSHSAEANEAPVQVDRTSEEGPVVNHNGGLPLDNEPLPHNYFRITPSGQPIAANLNANKENQFSTNFPPFSQQGGNPNQQTRAPENAQFSTNPQPSGSPSQEVRGPETPQTQFTSFLPFSQQNGSPVLQIRRPENSQNQFPSNPQQGGVLQNQFLSNFAHNQHFENPNSQIIESSQFGQTNPQLFDPRQTGAPVPQPARNSNQPFGQISEGFFPSQFFDQPQFANSPFLQSQRAQDIVNVPSVFQYKQQPQPNNRASPPSGSQLQEQLSALSSLGPEFQLVQQFPGLPSFKPSPTPALQLQTSSPQINVTQFANDFQTSQQFLQQQQQAFVSPASTRPFPNFSAGDFIINQRPSQTIQRVPENNFQNFQFSGQQFEFSQPQQSLFLSPTAETQLSPSGVGPTPPTIVRNDQNLGPLSPNFRETYPNRNIQLPVNLLPEPLQPQIFRPPAEIVFENSVPGIQRQSDGIIQYPSQIPVRKTQENRVHPIDPPPVFSTNGERPLPSQQFFRNPQYVPRDTEQLPIFPAQQSVPRLRPRQPEVQKVAHQNSQNFESITSEIQRVAPRNPEFFSRLPENQNHDSRQSQFSLRNPELSRDVFRSPQNSDRNTGVLRQVSRNSQRHPEALRENPRHPQISGRISESQRPAARNPQYSDRMSEVQRQTPRGPQRHPEPHRQAHRNTQNTNRISEAPRPATRGGVNMPQGFIGEQPSVSNSQNFPRERINGPQNPQNVPRPNLPVFIVPQESVTPQYVPRGSEVELPIYRNPHLVQRRPEGEVIRPGGSSPPVPLPESSRPRVRPNAQSPLREPELLQNRPILRMSSVPGTPQDQRGFLQQQPQQYDVVSLGQEKGPYYPPHNFDYFLAPQPRALSNIQQRETQEGAESETKPTIQVDSRPATQWTNF